MTDFTEFESTIFSSDDNFAIRKIKHNVILTYKNERHTSFQEINIFSVSLENLLTSAVELIKYVDRFHKPIY